MYYLISRYYDPMLGRFVSKDSEAIDPLEPVTLNLYTYAGNNPINFIDPDGKNFLLSWAKDKAKSFFNIKSIKPKTVVKAARAALSFAKPSFAVATALVVGAVTVVKVRNETKKQVNYGSTKASIKERGERPSSTSRKSAQAPKNSRQNEKQSNKFLDYLDKAKVRIQGIAKDGPRSRKEAMINQHFIKPAAMLHGIGSLALDTVKSIPNLYKISTPYITYNSVKDLPLAYSNPKAYQKKKQEEAKALAKNLWEQFPKKWYKAGKGIATVYANPYAKYGDTKQWAKDAADTALDATIVYGLATTAVKVGRVGKVARSTKMPKVEFHEGSLKHTFRNKRGHLPDTPQNRKLLINTASKRKNYLGTDQYGNEWYAQTRKDGTQVWVEVRNGEIRGGGLNDRPLPFNPKTGLKRLNRP